jgi:hypothetical protein
MAEHDAFLLEELTRIDARRVAQRDGVRIKHV